MVLSWVSKVLKYRFVQFLLTVVTQTLLPFSARPRAQYVEKRINKAVSSVSLTICGVHQPGQKDPKLSCSKELCTKHVSQVQGVTICFWCIHRYSNSDQVGWHSTSTAIVFIDRHNPDVNFGKPIHDHSYVVF